MARLWVLVAALAACTTTPPHDPVALATLSRTTIGLTTTTDLVVAPEMRPPAVQVSLDTRTIGANGDPADCPTIASDTTATFDGLDVELVNTGGWQPQEDSLGCDAIYFALPTAPSRTSGELVISDRSATWTVDGTRLLTADLALVPSPPTGHVQLVWPSAAEITSAFVQFAGTSGDVLWWGNSGDLGQGQISLTIVGDTIDFVVPELTSGSGTLSVYAYRLPPASRCDAPAGCSLQVSVGQAFAVAFP